MRDLGTKDSHNLRRFKKQFDEEDGFWLGLVMNNAEDGEAEFREFRREVSSKIAAALHERLEETNPLYKDMKFIDTNSWSLEVISLRIISNRKKGASAVCDGDSDSDEKSPESTNTDAVKAFMESFGVEQMRRLTEHYSALLLGKRAISEEADRPAGAGSSEVIIQQEWECFKADLLRGDIGIEKIASMGIIKRDTQRTRDTTQQKAQSHGRWIL